VTISHQLFSLVTGHSSLVRVAKSFANPCDCFIVGFMSTAREIEEAIRALSTLERRKLLDTIPDLFPELSGDADWKRIIGNECPRPGLTETLDKIEKEFRRDPEKFPELRDADFSSHS
jgi:hypothetical protein